MIFNLMNAKQETPNTNDYAVARALNESVKSIFFIIRAYQIIGPRNEFNADELNRAYIFLVNELETLYDHNSKLAEIKPEPTWKFFDVIKDKIYVIQKYNEEHDTMEAHILRVEKLCILSEQEVPQLSAKQKKYIDDMKTLFDKYIKLIKEVVEKIPKDTIEEDLQKDPRNRRFWCIEQYSVIYKPDGTILINNALKLKKIHAGSTAERLLEQSEKNPNQLFKPNLGQTARNLSTVLSSAGFNPTLRELFFPIVSEDKGVIFRPTVTRTEVLNERIDTFELDTILYKAGAEISVRPEEELVSLGMARPSDDDDD